MTDKELIEKCMPSLKVLTEWESNRMYHREAAMHVLSEAIPIIRQVIAKGQDETF